MLRPAKHHNESHTVFTETCHVRHQRSDIAIPTKDASVSEHGRNYQQPWSQILQKTELPFQPVSGKAGSEGTHFQI